MMVYLDTQVDKLDWEGALASVSPQRREAALRYVKDSDRKLSLAAYLLLEQALQKEYGITGALEFGFGPHGKPFLKAYPRIHFNLSHCPGIAMCVVDDDPVGCDVETVPPCLDMDLCRRVFSGEECAGILHAPHPPLAFTRLWTRKEAFLKYTGEGLTGNLEEVLASPRAASAVLDSTVAPDGSYVCSVCHSGKLMQRI